MNKKVTKIQVHEEFEPLQQADIQVYTDQLNKQIEKGFKYIEYYRDAIESLFETESNVSKMFDLAGEVFN